MRLMRELRFSPADARSAPPPNNWSGPLVDHPGAPLQVLRVVVQGAIDPRTGYVCDIKHLDALLRKAVAPSLSRAVRSDGPSLAEGVRAFQAAVRSVAGRCPAGTRLRSLMWQLSPYLSFASNGEEDPMVLITRSFEFAAAHRLACAGLSDEENRRLFGKCSNPHGHGHNYIVEVTVGAAADDDRAFAEALAGLDDTVRTQVIEPFDHRNLNTECADFSELNPTVENIARVVYSRLHRALSGCRLAGVRIWETAKTFAECDGSD